MPAEFTKSSLWIGCSTTPNARPATVSVAHSQTIADMSFTDIIILGANARRWTQLRSRRERLCQLSAIYGFASYGLVSMEVTKGFTVGQQEKGSFREEFRSGGLPFPLWERRWLLRRPTLIFCQ